MKSRVWLFLVSVGYAFLLSTPAGKRWAQAQTWTTVVAGTALTLAAMAADDRKLAERVFWYFAASGVPMVARSLILQMADRGDAEGRMFGGDST